MSEQLAFDAPSSTLTPRTGSSTRKPAPAQKWPTDPAKRALATYQAGILTLTAEALAATDTQRIIDRKDLVRGSGDFTVLSDYLTWLHAEVPAWIAKAAGLLAEGRDEAAQRCADLIASSADSMFTPDRRRRPRATGTDEEPQPSTIRTAVAEALGILAHREGGVTFSGQHWCVRRHAGCPGTFDVRYDHLHQVEISTTVRKNAGAHFTPRHLAEEVTDNALQPLVYAPGPLQTWCCSALPTDVTGHDCTKPHWRLKSSADILALRTADITVGSGAFLLAGARYLASRVLDAWESEGDSRAGDRGEALRLVIDNCLYGVDINPWSIELARLTLALLAPHTVMPNLTRHLLVGDSLLGVRDLEQIRWMDILPDRGRALHSVPAAYTQITGEFTDAVQAAMSHPRPDLRYPHLWDLFRLVCDLVAQSALATSINPDSIANRVIRLAAAKEAHDLLTANTSWRNT